MSSLIETMSKQVLRGRVLQICNEAQPLGAGTEVITAALRKGGYDTIKAEVFEACRYLEGKKLVEIETVVNKLLNIRRDIARITPEGIDVFEGTKEVEGIEL